MTTLDTLVHPLTPALLDVHAVAALLNCSVRHVNRLAAAGQMPSPLTLGTLVRWRRQDILIWILAGCPPCRKTQPHVGSAGHGGDTEGRRPVVHGEEKHAVSQQNWLDLLTTLISIAVSNLLVGADQSSIGGLVAAGVILLLKHLMARLRKS